MTKRVTMRTINDTRLKVRPRRRLSDRVGEDLKPLGTRDGE